MNKEKGRFEILLEEIRGNVKLVLEGHGVLDKKIDDLKTELKEDIGNLDAKINAVHTGLNSKIDAVHASLKQEIKVTGYALRDEIREVSEKLDAHLQVAAEA